MIDGTPTVDVVVCTNRNSPYLRAAVDSVVAQTYRPVNLIIVDDGGPRDAASALDDLVATLGIGTVVHQSPMGLPAARNAGIRTGQGEFVAFLDDDDVWDPHRLERNIAELQCRSSALGTFSGGWYMGADGARWEGGWQADAGTREEFLSGKVPLPRIVALTVRRSAWSAVGGFDPRYSLGEDIDFILRILAAGELVPTAGGLVGYRRHDANMTNAPLVQQHLAVEQVLGRLITQYEHQDQPGTSGLLRRYLSAYRRRASGQCATACLVAWRARDPRRLVREASWGLTRNPVALAKGAASLLRARAARGRQDVP